MATKELAVAAVQGHNAIVREMRRMVDRRRAKADSAEGFQACKNPLCERRTPEGGDYCCVRCGYCCVRCVAYTYGDFDLRTDGSRIEHGDACDTHHQEWMAT
jgi:hypothetical protein